MIYWMKYPCLYPWIYPWIYPYPPESANLAAPSATILTLNYTSKYSESRRQRTNVANKLVICRKQIGNFNCIKYGFKNNLRVFEL